VCFSSTAALLGPPGLANYAAANGFMDALMTARRAAGLPGLSVQWSTWARIGMVADLGAQHLRRHAAQGWRLIETQDGLRAFERLLLADTGSVSERGCDLPGTITAMPVDWQRLFSTFINPGEAMFADFAHLAGDDALAGGGNSMVASILSRPQAEREGFVLAELKRHIAAGFGFAESDVSGRESLISLGMDSLLAVQLRNSVCEQVGVQVPLRDLLNGWSIEDLAAHVVAELDAADPGGGDVAGDDQRMELSL